MGFKHKIIRTLTFAIGLVLVLAFVSSAADFRKLDSHLKMILKKNKWQQTILEEKELKKHKPEKIPKQTVKTLLMFEGSLEELSSLGVNIRSRAGNIFSVKIPIENLENLSDNPQIKFIESSKTLFPELDVSRVEAEVDHVHDGIPGYKGTDVIVGIIDTGIDWTHEDFQDDIGDTRILSIWDQSLTTEAGESSPSGFGYGVEYDSSDIDGSSLRHSDSNGHGTHVAGIAAGDGSATGNGEPAHAYVGMAPDADIIFVKNITSTDALGDSSQLFDAINYIFQKASALGKPAVINISQGDNLGPHDGSSLLEIGIDNLLSTPGRAIVKSAGNAGGDKIHASGTVTQDNTVEVPFVVSANDSAEDQISIWYEGTDSISVSIRSPAGASQDTTAFVSVKDNGDGDSLTDSLTNGNDVEIVSSSTNPLNGGRNILIKLESGSAGDIEDGTWHIRLHGDSITFGRFDAWIERGSVIPEFGSPFVDDSMTISIPGTSNKIITVGAYTTKNSWTDQGGDPHAISYNEGAIAYFSSLGPTRDGRDKPDICAPGQVIGSSLSTHADADFRKFFSNGGSDDGILEDGVHVVAQGTSMSAPHVTGAVALLLEKYPIAEGRSRGSGRAK